MRILICYKLHRKLGSLVIVTRRHSNPKSPYLLTSVKKGSGGKSESESSEEERPWRVARRAQTGQRNSTENGPRWQQRQRLQLKFQQRQRV